MTSSRDDDEPEFSDEAIKAAADVLRAWQRGAVSAETIFEEAVAAAKAAS